MLIVETMNGYKYSKYWFYLCKLILNAMNNEEYNMEFKNMDDLVNPDHQSNKVFENKLISELYELVFSYWPELEVHKRMISLQVIELAEICVAETMSCLVLAEEYLRTGERVSEESPVPKPTTREEAEIKMLELFRKFPKLNTQERRDAFWQEYEKGLWADHFFLAVHMKMKEALTDFYTERILKLEGVHLRLLDSYLYYLGAWPFVQGIYGLERSARDEKEQEAWTADTVR